MPNLSLKKKKRKQKQDPKRTENYSRKDFLLFLHNVSCGFVCKPVQKFRSLVGSSFCPASGLMRVGSCVVWVVYQQLKKKKKKKRERGVAYLGAKLLEFLSLAAEPVSSLNVAYLFCFLQILDTKTWSGKYLSSLIRSLEAFGPTKAVLESSWLHHHRCRENWEEHFYFLGNLVLWSEESTGGTETWVLENNQRAAKSRKKRKETKEQKKKKETSALRLLVGTQVPLVQRFYS